MKLLLDNEVVCICEALLHTSSESSRFQIALIPIFASTMILDVVPEISTPNEEYGRDTLQETQRSVIKMRLKAAADIIQ